MNVSINLNSVREEWRQQPVGQVVLDFTLSKTWVNVRSCVLKGAHGILVPVLLYLELVVVLSWSSQLSSGLGIVLCSVSVSHLLVSPGVLPIRMDSRSLMLLNKTFRSVDLTSIPAIRSLAVVKLMLSLFGCYFCISHDLFFEFFSELGKFFLL